MTGRPGEGPPEDGAAPLRTQPRPLVVHWLVDSAVVFVATIILALIIGVPWWADLVVSLVIGAIAARVTHQADVRAMAARRAG